jgi:hypothetical protein
MICTPLLLPAPMTDTKNELIMQRASVVSQGR